MSTSEKIIRENFCASPSERERLHRLGFRFVTGREVRVVYTKYDGSLDTGAGQRVHQGRFSGICITDQRDGCVGYFDSPMPLNRPGSLDLAQPQLEPRQPFANPPPVDFELGFARTARADSAAGAAASRLTRQVSPLASQSWL